MAPIFTSMLQQERDKQREAEGGRGSYLRLCNLRCVALNYAEDCERARARAGATTVGTKFMCTENRRNTFEPKYFAQDEQLPLSLSFPPLLAHTAYTQSSQFFFD